MKLEMKANFNICVVRSLSYSSYVETLYGNDHNNSSRCSTFDGKYSGRLPVDELGLYLDTKENKNGG